MARNRPDPLPEPLVERFFAAVNAVRERRPQPVNQAAAEFRSIVEGIHPSRPRLADIERAADRERIAKVRQQLRAVLADLD